MRQFDRRSELNRFSCQIQAMLSWKYLQVYSRESKYQVSFHEMQMTPESHLSSLETSTRSQRLYRRKRYRLRCSEPMPRFRRPSMYLLGVCFIKMGLEITKVSEQIRYVRHTILPVFTSSARTSAFQVPTSIKSSSLESVGDETTPPLFVFVLH